MSVVKKCFKCDQIKSLGEFYRYSRMADGHLNKCKECTKRDVAVYGRTPAGRATDQRRNQKPARKAACKKQSVQWHRDNPEKSREHARRWRRDNPEKVSECRSRWRKDNPEKVKAQRERYPEKIKARVAVCNAVRDGRLVRGACEHCDSTDGVEGHHEDYSRPLDVMWLCNDCHCIHEGRKVTNVM